jgi:hypothetical protein
MSDRKIRVGHPANGVDDEPGLHSKTTPQTRAADDGCADTDTAPGTAKMTSPIRVSEVRESAVRLDGLVSNGMSRQSEYSVRGIPSPSLHPTVYSRMHLWGDAGSSADVDDGFITAAAARSRPVDGVTEHAHRQRT